MDIDIHHAMSDLKKRDQENVFPGIPEAGHHPRLAM